MNRQINKRLRCKCGDRRFSVRLLTDEGVGLLTCSKSEHHSLLLDSREYWESAIQKRKPREQACSCGKKLFEVELGYALVDKQVRTIDLTLQCAACRQDWESSSIDIKYEPTASLINRPLDPIADPWTKARWFEGSAYWLPADVAALAKFAFKEARATCYLGPGNEPARPVTYAEMIRVSRGLVFDERELEIKNGGMFTLFLAAAPLKLPAAWRGSWKDQPVVEISFANIVGCQKKGGSPGENVTGLLYYISFARERRRGKKITKQPPAFLSLADRLHLWLSETFTTKRGTDCFDNPREYKRLKPSWDALPVY